MIKYFDTEAAYLAAVQDAESQVSLIGESNACKFDGRNVIVGFDSATTGSIAYLDDKKAIHFVATSTFNKTTFPESYEIFGVVVIGVDHDAFRGDVTVMNKEFASKIVIEHAYFSLTGFTLDGAEHTGTISIREVSDRWAVNHDYVITYRADNVEAFIAQLNDVFRAKDAFKAQDWVATADTEGNVILNYKNLAWQQISYNTAKEGFSGRDATAKDWIPDSKILRANGERTGEGPISNMDRALAYFRNDNSNTTYNPSTDVTSIRCRYPICLPSYLGTSEYQSDHCAYLRQVYGEGEEGWLKFMQSFLPILPSEYGALDRNKYSEMRITYYLASLKYTGQDGVEKCASPAADYVANIAYDHELLAKGKWFIGDIQRLFSLVAPLKYPTTNDRNADKTNAALNAIGASPFRNDYPVESCIRYDNVSPWIAYGNYGIANTYGGFSNASLCVPLVLLPRQRNSND